MSYSFSNVTLSFCMFSTSTSSCIKSSLFCCKSWWPPAKPQPSKFSSWSCTVCLCLVPTVWAWFCNFPPIPSIPKVIWVSLSELEKHLLIVLQIVQAWSYVFIKRKMTTNPMFLVGSFACIIIIFGLSRSYCPEPWNIVLSPFYPFKLSGHQLSYFLEILFSKPSTCTATWVRYVCKCCYGGWFFFLYGRARQIPTSHGRFWYKFEALRQHCLCWWRMKIAAWILTTFSFHRQLSYWCTKSDLHSAIYWSDRCMWCSLNTGPLWSEFNWTHEHLGTLFFGLAS